MLAIRSKEKEDCGSAFFNVVGIEDRGAVLQEDIEGRKGWKALVGGQLHRVAGIQLSLLCEGSATDKR